MTINLIPPKIKKERASQRTYGSIVFGIVMLGLLIIVTTSIFLISNIVVNKEVADTQTRINDQEATIVKYKDLVNKINTTNDKLKILDSYDANKILWSIVLTNLASSTPEAVQLTNFTITQNGLKGSVNGAAATLRDTAKLREKMEDSKYFKNVSFTTSAYRDSTTDYSFTISFEIESIK